MGSDEVTTQLAPPNPLRAVEERAQEIAKSLYPHQVEGVAFLLGRRRSLLADDMGLGKTRQSITAMKTEEPEGPYLVICPASVKRNWAREIETVLPVAETVIVGPDPPPNGDFKGWLIINYDLLGKHMETLSAFPWRGIVFDEAHYLKNYRSQRTLLATQLAKSASNDPAIHVLTGTPLTSRPRDLFPLLQLVNHPLGKSFRTFALRYCAAYDGEYGFVADGASNIEELTVQLHGILLRRTKNEVLDLPPKFRTWLEVDIHPKAVENLNRAVRHFLEASPESDEPEESDDEISDAERRQRSGRRLGQLMVTRRKLALIKLPHTVEYVQSALEQDEKVIVFSAFEGTIQRLKRVFGEECVVVTGNVPSEERQERVDRFQTDKRIRVFLANLYVGGVGLNLTAARQVVFNDLDWVPTNHWQAEDRAYRIGQTGAVNVTYVVGRGTVDEFVRTVLETKAHLIDNLIEGKALGDDLQADVLTELKRMVNFMGPHLDSLRQGAERMNAAIREISSAYTERNAERYGDLTRRKLLPYSEAAVRALARALAGPERTQYRTASSSKPGTFYTLEVLGADVTCDCPGFSYRGNCNHVRTLKDALVTERGLPKGYVKVE